MTHDAKRRFSGHRLISVGFAALGVAALALSFPALGARLALVSADSLRDRYMAGSALSQDELQAWEASAQRALKWRTASLSHDDLASIAFLRAQYAVHDRDAMQRAYLESINQQRRSLEIAPSNPYGWMRLAYLDMQANGVSPGVAKALTHSLQTGPYEPVLAFSRLSMAITLSDHLQADVRERIPAMARQAYELEPWQFAKAAKQEHFISIAEQALMNDPESLKTFRELVAEESP